MLTSLYTAMFRPMTERHFTSPIALIVGGLVILILALNAAGTLGVGVIGLIPLLNLFLLAGLVGWFWLSASVHLVAQWFGGQGTGLGTAIAMAEGFFPLILTAPAIAAANWAPGLGALFSLLIAIGVGVIWVMGIRTIHHLPWGQAIAVLAITFALAGLALTGLILWPLMLILGT